jgi:hypothetical protein
MNLVSQAGSEHSFILRSMHHNIHTIHLVPTSSKKSQEQGHLLLTYPEKSFM